MVVMSKEVAILGIGIVSPAHAISHIAQQSIHAISRPTTCRDVCMFYGFLLIRFLGLNEQGISLWPHGEPNEKFHLDYIGRIRRPR